MVVRCERCETRFKLDESRLPARGARVRCSRCKHAFFVTPPGADPAEAVHEVAAAAARAPAESLRGPEPSWDLEENPDSTVARRKPLAAPRLPGPAEEDASDWRFEDEAPGLDPGATRSSSFDLGGAQAPPSFAAPPDPNEDSFAELGDPATWDLLAGDAPEGAPPASAPAAPESMPMGAPPAADPRERTAPALGLPAEAAAAETQPAPAPAARAPYSFPAGRTAFAPPPVVMPRRLPPAPRGLSAQGWGGWAATVALAAGVAWASLGPATTPESVRSLPPVSGFEVSEARARVIDNAAAGPILVVSGRLRNPGPSARALGAPLTVQLLDDRGAPIAAAGVAGPALPEPRVREEAPEQLVASRQDAAAALVRTPVAAGGDLAFAAIFAPAPHGATRFVLTARSSPP